jgi:5-methyltetrahydropteroyltriglutamate--homocysteine methyltransferase
MLRSSERILTTHSGSLPRPVELTKLHADRFSGIAIDEDRLSEATTEATRSVISAQVDAGIDIGNNGEAGRESFFTYVQHRMTGFGGASARAGMADILAYPSYIERMLRNSNAHDSVSLLSGPKCIAEIGYPSTALIEAECSQLRALLDERDDGGFFEAFVSSPSPGIVCAAMSNEHYSYLEDYVDAVADALAIEYRAILDAGFVLQIDAPDLAMERHTLFADRPLEEFLDFARHVVTAMNRALEGMDRDRIRLHVCWGNYEGPHDRDVALAEIWETVSAVRANAVLLSLANPRHAHEVRLFETVALREGVTLVAGVIDTTTNYIEHPEVVADRIEKVARVLGDPTRVIAGTDCGFETAAGFSAVAEELVWQKLRALAQGAEIATRRLFG